MLRNINTRERAATASGQLAGVGAADWIIKGQHSRRPNDHRLQADDHLLVDDEDALIDGSSQLVAGKLGPGEGQPLREERSRLGRGEDELLGEEKLDDVSGGQIPAGEDREEQKRLQTFR